MKSVVLNANGLTFDSTFKTVVTKVKDDNAIVVDALSKVLISLGDNKASDLGIVVNSEVTIKPSNKDDGTFTLEVGEVKKKADPMSTRSSSPALGERFTNDLR